MTDSAPQSSRLGKYEIIAEIARGGMGIVYLARLSGGLGGFNKLVVLKELKPELAGEDGFREMFLDEARLTARLNHRNIVQTNEVGVADGRYFIAMDYLEGRPLNAVVRAFVKGTPVSLHTHLRILAETLAGLHYAHELTDFDDSSLGIIHRDICPQNVFITFDGQVKIVDFGVAKARNRLQETEAGTLKGRVTYMAPEQLSGSVELDRRADIFAVGAMLWEAVAGERLWGKKPELEILRSLIEGKIPELPASAASAPEELRAMIVKATAADPTKRFSTAHEFRQKIEQFLLRAGAYESMSDLGTRMMEAFASDREKLRKVVEGHVAKGASDTSEPPKLEFKATAIPSVASQPDISSQPDVSSQPNLAVKPDPGSHPNLDTQPTVVAKASQPNMPAVRPGATSQPNMPAVRPAATSQPNMRAALTSSPNMEARSSGRLPDAGASGPQSVAAIAAAAGHLPVAPVVKYVARPTSKFPWVLSALGLLVAAGAVAYAVNAQNQAAAPSGSASGAGSLTVPSDLPSSTEPWVPTFGVETVNLTITSVPPNANIYLDGQLLPSNPFTAKQKKGGTHKISATAPGYLPHTQESNFDTDLYVTVTLEVAPEGGLVITVPTGGHGATNSKEQTLQTALQIAQGVPEGGVAHREKDAGTDPH